MHRYCTALIAAALAGPCTAQPAATQPGSLPTITVVHPGAAPHQPLRLRPSIGARHDFDVRLSRETLDADPGAMEAPSMIWTFASVIVAAPKPHEVQAEFDCTGVRIEDTPGMPPEILEGMRQAVGPLTGLHGVATLSDRGAAVNAQVLTPPDLNVALTPYVIGVSNMVRQLATTLPEAPVGAGAAWTVESVENLEGLTVQQTLKYTLRETDGQTLTIDFEIRQRGGDQQINVMGQTATVKAFVNEGGGTIVRRLDRVFPQRVELSVVNDVTIAVPQPAPQREVRQRMRQVTKVETRDSP